MYKRFNLVRSILATMIMALLPSYGWASSHMDAPSITLDPAANTTDVYSFVRVVNGVKLLNVALGVYPHENATVGPNKYNFDDNVLYQIHVALGPDVQAGVPTISYQFRFNTSFKSQNTILQSYLGVIQSVGDANQNLTQTYTVTKVDNRSGRRTRLGSGIVPPNNEGVATPFYNRMDSGTQPARMGVSTNAQLDRYTQQGIAQLRLGYNSFAGQRDDGFYADVDSVFDLLQLRPVGVDSQGGFNIHMMALQIPVAELGGDQQVVGVYATTSRQSIKVLNSVGGDTLSGSFVQVARQGNPLFNEVLVAIKDKDMYSRSNPSIDSSVFRTYAENPEVARLANAILGLSPQAPETNRTDISGIFIPDLIKTDLSTPSVRLAGNGPSDANNPDDAGFSRLSVLGGDVLPSTVTGGMVAGGWPNGRRFGDDVVDIGVSAIISDLRNNPPAILRLASDGVDSNELGYNKTFPYEATPQNGRNVVKPVQPPGFAK